MGISFNLSSNSRPKTDLLSINSSASVQSGKLEIYQFFHYTLAIIETFVRVKEIERTIKAIRQTPQNSPKYQELMQKTGDLISELVVPQELEPSETEASIEVNLALVKLKYTIKKKSKYGLY